LGASSLLGWLAAPAAADPQPDDGVTYAAKISKAETRIDWSQSAAQLVRQVLAFAPAPGAWFEANGERIKLLAAEQAVASGKPGEVLEPFAIACGDGAVRPTLLQRAGRGPMTPGELLRGFAIPAGTILQ
jgi:methionyl-tRNA formyltransferase